MFIVGGLVVNPAVITANLLRELPFLACEVKVLSGAVAVGRQFTLYCQGILMEAAKRGDSRQEAHEVQPS